MSEASSPEPALPTPPQPAPPTPAPPTPPSAPTRRRRVLTIVIAAVVAVVVAVAVGSWLHVADPLHKLGGAASPVPVTYTSTEHGYAIDFPGKPTRSTSSAGTVVVETAEWTAGGRDLSASAFTLPDAPADQAATLDSALKGSFENVKGALLKKQSATTLDGMAAVRGDGTYGTHPMVVVIAADGPTLYVVSGVSPLPSGSDGVISSFIASFHRK